MRQGHQDWLFGHVYSCHSHYASAAVAGVNPDGSFASKQTESSSSLARLIVARKIYQHVSRCRFAEGESLVKQHSLEDEG